MPTDVYKIIDFFKRFWAIIGGLGVIAALLSDSKSILEGCKSGSKNESSVIAKTDSLDCNFPKIFKDDSLYVLITAFEDDAQKYGTDCFGLSLLRRIDAKKMPIKICYKPELAPKQRDEVRKLQNQYNADLVLWGNLKNLSKNCGEGDICFKSQPSDTIIKICGGEVETEKFDLNYEKGISSEDIEEKGDLHIGDLAFDSWIYAIFNAKVGKKKPDFFIVDESLPKKKQVELWKSKGDLYISVKNFIKSIECYDKSLKLDSKNVGAYQRRGEAKFNLKDYNGAISDLDNAIKLNPKDIGLFEFRAHIKNHLEDYKGAILDFNEIIKIDSNAPISFVIYNDRGIAKYNLKDYANAILDLDKAIQFVPTYSTSYYTRGNAKYNMKDYSGAILDIDKAIQLKEKAESYNTRGCIKTTLKDYTGAIKDFDKAIKIDPSLAMFYFNRSNAKNYLEDYDGAILDCNKALQIDPKLLKTYDVMGFAKLNLKDYSGIILDSEKAIQLDPNSIEAYYYRGFAKANLGDYTGAILDFDKIIELNPKYADAYYKRGLLYGKIGKKEKSTSDLKKAEILGINQPKKN